MGFDVGVHVRGSAEAVELYRRAFGLELGYHVLNPDGSYFHAELCEGGQNVLTVAESSEGEVTGNAVCIGRVFESEDEVRRVYGLLKEGGQIKTPLGALPWCDCAADVIDRYGIWWYLCVAQHRPAEGFSAADSDYLK